MVKANGYCKYAKDLKQKKILGSLQTFGTTCQKGYKKCTGQGCKNFDGTKEWEDFLQKRAVYKNKSRS